MLKLIRNAWADKKLICNAKNEIIDWNYICQLFDLESSQGLRLGTKLTKRHLFFGNEKMNVRLAAQLLSQSVADALSYLEKTNTNFKNVSPTSEFISFINNAFDILNSRSKFSLKPYNKPISKNTIDNYKIFIEQFEQYINGLQFLERNKSTNEWIRTKVVVSNRKTGFIGFILALKNSINLFEYLYVKGDIEYLITYKLSQDHIETTFSAIRGRGGYNDNPTCRQFQAAYKRILVHNQLTGSNFGNCSILDGTQILPVSTKLSSRKINGNVDLSFDWVPNRTLIDHDYFKNIIEINTYIEDVSQYIGGFVARKIIQIIPCYNCKKILSKDQEENKSLISCKDRGGLTKPSNGVKIICAEAERVLRCNLSIVKSQFHKKEQLLLLNKVKTALYSKFDPSILICSNISDDFSILDQHNHKDQLINLICLKYFDIRVHHEIRKLNESTKSRSKLTKLVHFRHE